MSDEKACACRQPDCFACELASLRQWLLAHGLHIVTEAEKRVLDALSEVPGEVLCDTISSKYTQAFNKRAAEAELSRRTP